MAIEVSQNEEISGGGKEIVFAILRRRANGGNIKIKK